MPRGAAGETMLVLAGELASDEAGGMTIVVEPGITTETPYPGGAPGALYDAADEDANERDGEATEELPAPVWELG